jgi:hypothetical protein
MTNRIVIDRLDLTCAASTKPRRKQRQGCWALPFRSHCNSGA